MQHIDAETLEELRGALLAERDSLEEELGERGVKSGGDWQGVSGSSGEEADPNTAADNIEELATNVSIVEELERRFKEVSAALERIEKGAYGIDTKTGEPIDIDRLKANPAATVNI